MRLRTFAFALAAAAAGSVVVAVPAAHAAAATTKSIDNGQYSGCAILYNDTVKCWGSGYSGQLGSGDTTNRGDDPNEMGDNLPTVDLGTGRTAKSIGAGYEHSCAILDNDALKCWGDNYYGQLGLGDNNNRGDVANEMGESLSAVDLGTGRTAKVIAPGTYSTCAILDNDTLKCWGRNDNGSLGLGDTNHRGDGGGEMGDSLPAVNLGTGRTAKAVGVGDAIVCAILDDNTVKCWGNNNTGQLGQGDTNNRGDEAGEMGDALLPVNLGTGRTAKAIAVGETHVCALLDDNTVKCWGVNGRGPLGQGDTNNRGDEGGEMGDALLPVNLGTGRTAKAITAGYRFSCALLDDNTVKCWGDDADGSLGQGDTSDRGDAAGEMGDALLPINLGTGRTAKAISAAGESVCALLDNNLVKCWGDNEYGHLGHGDNDDTDGDRGDQPNEMGDSLVITDLGTMPDPPILPPTGSNTLVLLVAALGLLGAGSIVLITRRRTA